MGMTLAQAGKRVGKGRSTLLRHISEGRLSASKDERARWIVDESELARAYPETFTFLSEEAPKGDTEGVSVGAHAGAHGETAGELAVRVEMLTAEVDRERRERAELRDELRGVRDELRAAQSKVTGLLETPREEARPGFVSEIWQRMFGR